MLSDIVNISEERLHPLLGILTSQTSEDSKSKDSANREVLYSSNI